MIRPDTLVLATRNPHKVSEIAALLAGIPVRVVEGRTDGIILETPRGDAGFGYDPLFLPDGFRRSYAEMSAGEKNRVSHRGKALAAARGLIEELFAS